MKDGKEGVRKRGRYVERGNKWMGGLKREGKRDK